MTAHPVSAPPPTATSAVDYLTVTSDTRWRLLALRDFAVDLGARLARGGYDICDHRTLGYVGWQCGQLTYAERRDGALLRLSGAAAAEWWREVIPRARNVTRLDLAVTVAGVDPAVRLSERHEAEAIAAVPPVGRPPTIRLFREHQRGQTLYLGSRQSAVYRRCYDKHHESPDQYPPGTWRYEVEYKGDVAALVGRGLLDAGAGAAGIAPLVHRQFATHGVAPWFAPETVTVADRHVRPPSDDERRLRWLREQVAPSLRRLTLNGRGEDAWRALTDAA